MYCQGHWAAKKKKKKKTRRGTGITNRCGVVTGTGVLSLASSIAVMRRDCNEETETRRKLARVWRRHLFLVLPVALHQLFFSVEVSVCVSLCLSFCLSSSHFLYLFLRSAGCKIAITKPLPLSDFFPFPHSFCNSLSLSLSYPLPSPPPPPLLSVYLPVSLCLSMSVSNAIVTLTVSGNEALAEVASIKQPHCQPRTHDTQLQTDSDGHTDNTHTDRQEYTRRNINRGEGGRGGGGGGVRGGNHTDKQRYRQTNK